MKSINFSPYTQLLKGSGDIGDLHVLPVNYDILGNAIISCWHVSWLDLLKLIFTHKIYVSILGTRQPVMQLNIDKDDIGVTETEENLKAAECANP